VDRGQSRVDRLESSGISRGPPFGAGIARAPTMVRTPFAFGVVSPWSILVLSALGCGDAINANQGAGDAAPDTSKTHEAGTPRGGDAAPDAVVGDAEPEGSIGDAAQCKDASPPPDGSTACDGFSPGSCVDTACSPEGLLCSYPATDLTAVCCGGVWVCTGI
jgi:hypothetical protein